MICVQCDFEIKENGKVTKQTAWVDSAWKRGGLRKGNKVSFTDDRDGRIWTVTYVGSIKIDVRDLHQTWPAGGL